MLRFQAALLFHAIIGHLALSLYDHVQWSLVTLWDSSDDNTSAVCWLMITLWERTTAGSTFDLLNHFKAVVLSHEVILQYNQNRSHSEEEKYCRSDELLPRRDYFS